MQISFKSEIQQLTKDLNSVRASAIPRATVQALNRTALGVRTDAVKDVRAKTGITATNVRKALEIIQATQNKPAAVVDAKTGRARNLINYVTPSTRRPGYYNKRLKRGGYKSHGVQARAWGQRKTYKGTFIGRGKDSGAYLVFARTGQARTPIKSILGPSVRSEFIKDDMQRKLRGYAAVRFDKNFRDALRINVRQFSRISA